MRRLLGRYIPAQVVMRLTGGGPEIGEGYLTYRTSLGVRLRTSLRFEILRGYGYLRPSAPGLNLSGTPQCTIVCNDSGG